jgi:hypothetical protein
MSALKSGDAVKVSRPSKKGHGHVGRLVEVGQASAFAWVSFHKREPDRTEAPPADALHRQDLYPRLLLPISQLEKL